MARLNQPEGQGGGSPPPLATLLFMGLEGFVATLAVGVVVYVVYLGLAWIRIVFDGPV